MKAVRLHQYHEQPKVEEVAEPKITGPHDVIVKIGGAGVLERFPKILGAPLTRNLPSH